jgi:tetratricopeptide (TPR) repeat protein
MKVAVCSIAKNEAKHVKRWFESAKDADYVYMLDTGSQDDTVKIAKELGIHTFVADIQPWHFANARNMLLDMLPDDIDWIINLDLDEVLVDGWRGELEKVPNDGSITRPRYQYTWNWNPDGTPGLQYSGDKIVRRHSHRWKGACHEVNVVQPGYEERQTFCGVKIEHYADNTKSRSSYLGLLALDIEEDPHNDRNRYYYARELYFNGQFEKAIEQFLHHLSMPEARWDAERAWSMRYLARMIPAQTEVWLLKSCAEYPAAREPWVDLAEFYHNKNNHAGSFFAASKALAIKDKGGLYLNEAQAWGWKPYDLAAIAAFYLGAYEDAYMLGLVALRLNPEDTRIQANVRYYEEKIPEQTRAQYQSVAAWM